MTDTSIPLNHSASNQSLGSGLPDDVVNTVNDMIDKKEQVKIGALTVLDRMIADNVDFARFPVIGSDKGNNPHYFPMSTDSGREATGDAFVEMYKGTDTGKQYLRDLADIKLAEKPETEGQVKIDRIKGKGAVWLKDERNLLTARIRAGGALIQTAVALFQQEETFRTSVNSELVYFDRNWETEGVLKRTRTPYIIADMKKPIDAQRLTIEQFLNLDVATANLNGGTYQALKATLKKGASDGTPATNFDSVASLVDALDAGARFLDPEDEGGQKRIDRFANYVTSKPENLLRFGDFMMACDKLWEEIAPEYRKLSAKRRHDTRDLNATHVKTA